MQCAKQWFMGLLGLVSLAAPLWSEGSEEIPTEALSGGETTVFDAGRNAFGMPLANITRLNQRAHVVGNSFFNQNWVIAPASTTARDGLGPLFHARSCSACHLHDGRGAPPEKGELMTSLLFRLSMPEAKNEHGGPVPHPELGGQLGVRAIPGAEPEGDVAIIYEEIAGQYPDGTRHSLRKPNYVLQVEGLEEDLPIAMSPRMPIPTTPMVTASQVVRIPYGM